MRASTTEIRPATRRSRGGPPILGYVASASANGQTTRTCTTTSESTCTLAGLTSDVAYTVTVVAKNAVGTSAPSSPFVSTPN